MSNDVAKMVAKLLLDGKSFIHDYLDFKQILEQKFNQNKIDMDEVKSRFEKQVKRNQIDIDTLNKLDPSERMSRQLKTINDDLQDRIRRIDNGEDPFI